MCVCVCVCEYTHRSSHLSIFLQTLGFGIEITGPISAEQIVAANPDAILLIDMNGSGKAMFQELLNNQAVAQLPAVSGDKIKLIEGRYVQALGVTDTISGLKQLTEWIDSL